MADTLSTEEILSIFPKAVVEEIQQEWAAFIADEYNSRSWTALYHLAKAFAPPPRFIAIDPDELRALEQERDALREALLLIEPASFTEAEREVLKSTALGRKTLRVVAELEAFIRSLSEPLFDDEAWGPVCAWCGYEVTTSGHDKDCAWTRRAALTGEGKD